LIFASTAGAPTNASQVAQALGLVRVANRGIDARPLVRSCFAEGMSAGASDTDLFPKQQGVACAENLPAIDHGDDKIEAPAFGVNVFLVGAEAHVNAGVGLCEPMQARDQPAHG